VLYFELTKVESLPDDYVMQTRVLRNDHQHMLFKNYTDTKLKYEIAEFGKYKIFINFKFNNTVAANVVTENLEYNRGDAPDYFDTADDDDFQSGLARLKRVIEKHENNKSIMQDLGPYNFVEFLLACGITTTAIYAEEKQYDLTTFIASTLFIDSRIIVTKYLSNAKYYIYSRSKIEPDRSFPMVFEIEDDFSKYDTILFIDFDNNNALFDKITKVCPNVVRINQSFIDTLRNYFYFYLPIFSKANLNPEVDFIINHINNRLSPLPLKIPLDNPTKDEKWIYDKGYNLGHIIAFVKNDERIPKALSSYGFTKEELLEIMTPPGGIIIDGVSRLKDQSAKHVNILNGTRITPGQPEVFDRNIYYFGFSALFGIGATDDGTKTAHLQRFISPHADIIVHNCCNAMATRTEFTKQFFSMHKFLPGDIVVYDVGRFTQIEKMIKETANVYFCDSVEAIKHKSITKEIYVDDVHFNNDGYEMLAKYLYDFIVEKGILDKSVSKKDVVLELEEKKSSLPAEYVAELKKYKELLLTHKAPTSGKIGSIVMNCNPFTLGHRYLVEYAASQVEHLYIFAVEEDKSIFPFADRFELIKAGTKDLPNITVLPSGKFIISSLTFTDYFNKSDMQDRIMDPCQDAALFAEQVAPTLGITVRFSGKLPVVKRQQSETLKRVLEEHGIEYSVVPLHQIDGVTVSSSQVRKLLEEKNFEEITKLVPETTLE
jgi:[citrate (pro-3S)-lyase] ligase